jgi:hypothetical protein
MHVCNTTVDLKCFLNCPPHSILMGPGESVAQASDGNLKEEWEFSPVDDLFEQERNHELKVEHSVCLEPHAVLYLLVITTSTRMRMNRILC